MTLQYGGMKDLPPSLLSLTTYLLSKSGKSARGRMAARLADSGWRMWHLAVLAALADFGPQAQRDLSARLGIDPSDVVKILDDLTAAGHVDRTRDLTDRRRVTTTITPGGRVELGRLFQEARAVQEEVLAPLSEPERELLHSLLTRLGTTDGS
jgi:DNA-binding MarR family transcriptional regulator